MKDERQIYKDAFIVGNVVGIMFIKIVGFLMLLTSPVLGPLFHIFLRFWEKVDPHGSRYYTTWWLDTLTYFHIAWGMMTE